MKIKCFNEKYNFQTRRYMQTICIGIPKLYGRFLNILCRGIILDTYFLLRQYIHEPADIDSYLFVLHLYFTEHVVGEFTFIF